MPELTVKVPIDEYTGTERDFRLQIVNELTGEVLEAVQLEVPLGNPITIRHNGRIPDGGPEAEPGHGPNMEGREHE